MSLQTQVVFQIQVRKRLKQRSQHLIRANPSRPATRNPNGGCASQDGPAWRDARGGYGRRRGSRMVTSPTLCHILPNPCTSASNLSYARPSRVCCVRHECKVASASTPVVTTSSSPRPALPTLQVLPLGTHCSEKQTEIRRPQVGSKAEHARVGSRV